MRTATVQTQWRDQINSVKLNNKIVQDDESKAKNYQISLLKFM